MTYASAPEDLMADIIAPSDLTCAEVDVLYLGLFVSDANLVAGPSFVRNSQDYATQFSLDRDDAAFERLLKELGQRNIAAFDRSEVDFPNAKGVPAAVNVRWDVRWMVMNKALVQQICDLLVRISLDAEVIKAPALDRQKIVLLREILKQL